MFTSKIWLMNGIENFIQIRCRDTYDGLLCSKRTRRYGNFIDGEQKKNIERTSLGSIEWNAQTHVLVVYFTHQPPTTLVVSDDSTSAQQCSEFRRRGDKDWHTCKHEPTHISRCRGRHRREFCTQDESQQQKGPRASGGSEWAHTRVCAGMCADRLLVGRKKKWMEKIVITVPRAASIHYYDVLLGFCRHSSSTGVNLYWQCEKETNRSHSK